MSYATPPAPGDLVAALDSELQAYRQLLLLTKRERDALQRGDLAAVASVLRDKGMTMRSLSENEKTRTHLTADLAVAAGLPPDAGLQALITTLDESYALDLQSLRQECVALVGQLQILNQGNSGLIQTRLTRIEATLDFLARSAGDCDVPYTAHGNNVQAASSGHMLNWHV